MAARLEEVDINELNCGSPPLILIHDGGGTTFQYYMLGPLQRSTYAISNPYFRDGVAPPGGIPHLAEEYAAAIRKTMRGRIIIGGRLSSAQSLRPLGIGD